MPHRKLLAEAEQETSISPDTEAVKPAIEKRVEDLEVKMADLQARFAVALMSSDKAKREMSRTKFLARVSVEVLLVAASCILLAATLTLRAG